ncbi:uncharacterized protein VP01_774g3 [Puccinia sorghi]|uniref:CCHC-type domain-containing protein n=1 Tax=Puccinia sorghi TaxID=27349 RepID=A0A0L6UDI5_9BASI|nr:uncharacterized protein VP01_774g3 [Puccinia sorghi]
MSSRPGPSLSCLPADLASTLPVETCLRFPREKYLVCRSAQITTLMKLLRFPPKSLIDRPVKQELARHVEHIMFQHLLHSTPTFHEILKLLDTVPLPYRMATTIVVEPTSVAPTIDAVDNNPITAQATCNTNCYVCNQPGNWANDCPCHKKPSSKIYRPPNVFQHPNPYFNPYFPIFVAPNMVPGNHPCSFPTFPYNSHCLTPQKMLNQLILNKPQQVWDFPKPIYPSSISLVSSHSSSLHSSQLPYIRVLLSVFFLPPPHEMESIFKYPIDKYSFNWDLWHLSKDKLNMLFWHQPFGHSGLCCIRKMEKLKLGFGLPEQLQKGDIKYPVCMIAKGKRNNKLVETH